ncbi:cytochrome P450, partial [Dendrothele bispora CBS 962.96]
MGQGRSFCGTLAESGAIHGMSDEECAWLAGVLYAAGQETSTNALHWFLFSMLLFPQVQRRAQEELDRVVGRSRLPSFADAKHLPYVQAIVNEILRWKPPTPVGIPHASIEDAYYDGFFIPKGTVLIPNVWFLNRDPETYGPDADQFRPERHLDQDGNLRDPN